MASSYYRGQGNRKKKKKDPWDPLKPLDDARAEWEKRKKEEAEEQPPEKDEVEEQPPKEKKAEKEPSKLAEGLEGLSDALIGSDEAESTLESIKRLTDAVVTIQKISDNRKKAGEPTKTESGENIATKSMEHYFNADVDYGIKFNDGTDFSEFNTEKLLQLDFNDPKQKVIAKNWYVNKLDLDYSEEHTSYKQMRKTADERHKRRMEDALAKGNPLKQFELDKQRSGKNIPAGTPVNELFKKPEDVNKVAKDQADATKITNETNKENLKDETNKEKLDVVKDTNTIFKDNIDGQIGDFFDPDDWKKRSLFGRMA